MRAASPDPLTITATSPGLLPPAGGPEPAGHLERGLWGYVGGRALLSGLFLNCYFPLSRTHRGVTARTSRGPRRMFRRSPGKGKASRSQLEARPQRGGGPAQDHPTDEWQRSINNSCSQHSLHKRDGLEARTARASAQPSQTSDLAALDLSLSISKMGITISTSWATVKIE